MTTFKWAFCLSTLMLVAGCLPTLTNPFNSNDKSVKSQDLKTKTADERVYETIKRLTDDAMASKEKPISLSQHLKFFNAVKLSTEKNPQVERAQQQILSAGFGKDIALSAKKVQFKTSGGLGLSAKRESSKTVNKSGAAISVQASLLLFDGGAINSQIDVAEANYLIAEISLEIERARIAYEASNAWFEMWAATESQSLFSKNEKEINVIKKQLETLQKTGILNVGELADVNGKMVDLELTRRKIQHSKDLAKLNFELHFGPNLTANRLPEMNKLVRSRKSTKFNGLEVPAIKKLLVEHAIAQFRISEAKAALKPKISSSISLSSPQSVNGSTDTRVGLFLDYVIGDGGRRAARISAAETNFNSISAEINHQLKQAQVELDGAKKSLASNRSIFMTSNSKIQLLEKQLATASSQRALGQAAIQKVFDLKIEIFEEKLELIQLRISLYKSAVELQLATGQLLNLFALR